MRNDQVENRRDVKRAQRSQEMAFLAYVWSSLSSALLDRFCFRCFDKAKSRPAEVLTKDDDDADESDKDMSLSLVPTDGDRRGKVLATPTFTTATSQLEESSEH
ncbi:unnamed protein product [Anisakis simplex]|uniref:Uncharacterized protein n=1 Tax=Anisakis simplex TaxID=6269 RepID=A0A0M3JTQ0_ANISI|nr:unnamed protein product [Anisakis simplex]